MYGLLGQVIRQGCSTVSSPPIDANRSLQMTSNIMELRSLLDLCNALYWVVPSFTWIAALLNCKLQKEERQVYTELCIEERDTLDTLEE